MSKLLKITLVIFAVIAGASAVQAGDCKEGKSVIEQIMEDQLLNGN